MNLSKLSLTLLIVMVVVVSVLMGAYIVFSRPPAFKPSQNNPAPVQTQQQAISVVIDAKQTNISVGNKVLVSVYLRGQDAEKITAFDFKLDYDKTKLKLVEAIPGGFFNKYIQVKWDLAAGWFSEAVNPSETRTNAKPELPVMTLEFTALSRSGSTLLSIKSDSLIYISGLGGESPISQNISFTIK